MRVISGLRKGHRLKSPKGMDVRPTEDKIKESLFNIIGKIDESSVVLDLFGGTGSIGIEFLSRGAKKSYFVDVSPNSISCIKDNLNHTKLNELAVVIKSDSIRAIKQLYNDKLIFNYIYIDPPFRKNQLLTSVLSTLAEYPIMNINSIIIIEHESELVLEDKIFNFNKFDERKYGSKTISFFKSVL
ncbi:MAG: 16S rRNA (guanine(966)-N(2))-methyltransferase RsmD [Tissierellaceae bacterium]|nr:16S rRNA (guanine(966)-N(2))-methyltransferase RsmD [Tissierellaceae bacterium]